MGIEIVVLFSKNITAMVILCFVFIGQTITQVQASFDALQAHCNMHQSHSTLDFSQAESPASAITELETTQSSSAHMSDGSKHHTSMQNATSDVTSMQQMDCCQSDCQCPPSMCHVSSYLVSGSYSLFNMPNTPTAFYSLTDAPQSITGQLYRPPIFT